MKVLWSPKQDSKQILAIFYGYNEHGYNEFMDLESLGLRHNQVLLYIRILHLLATDEFGFLLCEIANQEFF